MSIRSHDCVCSVNLDHGHYYWYCWYRHNLFGITSFHCLSQARYSRCSKAKQIHLAPTPKMALCGIELVDHNNFETDDIREQKLLWSQHLNPLQAEPSLWRWLQRAAHWSKSSRNQLWWRVCNVWWITVNWNLNELTTKNIMNKIPPAQELWPIEECLRWSWCSCLGKLVHSTFLEYRTLSFLKSLVCWEL